MMQKYIYNNRFFNFCVRLLMILIFCSISFNSLYADSSFRKRGAIIFSATPLLGKEINGIDQSTNNNFGFKPHNYQFGRYAIDLAYNVINNFSIGVRYFETKNQKNSFSYPSFPTVPINYVNYSNSYEYELRYRQPSGEIFMNYYPFAGNDFFFTFLIGKTAGTIETYQKNDLASNSASSSRRINDFPSSVKITNDPMIYYGMGIGYRWSFLEKFILDISYDLKLPGRKREYIAVNDNLLFLAINPNSSTAIQSISTPSVSLTSVQSIYIRIGIAF